MSTQNGVISPRCAWPHSLTYASICALIRPSTSQRLTNILSTLINSELCTKFNTTFEYSGNLDNCLFFIELNTKVDLKYLKYTYRVGTSMGENLRNPEKLGENQRKKEISSKKV